MSFWASTAVESVQEDIFSLVTYYLHVFASLLILLLYWDAFEEKKIDNELPTPWLCAFFPISTPLDYFILKNRASLSTNQCKAETNCDVVSRVFPRFKWMAYFHFEFSLALVVFWIFDSTWGAVQNVILWFVHFRTWLSALLDVHGLMFFVPWSSLVGHNWEHVSHSGYRDTL